MNSKISEQDCIIKKNEMTTMRKILVVLLIIMLLGVFNDDYTVMADERQSIKAIYIPLADHYAGIIAYEKYRAQMKKAEYSLERIGSWPELRNYFMSGEIDMAFIICPMAMDMFFDRPDFRWVSLMHRDGNALAINGLLNEDVNLSKNRKERKPDEKVANAFVKAKRELGRPVQCGVPSLLATHTVVLYKYLKDNGVSLGLGYGPGKDVIALEISPPKSPSFLRRQNSRGRQASFEQSLPWADVVETQGFGYVAWYSKDVIVWPNGHVECIVIATDNAIKEKNDALKEVIYYIHKAGIDIENARRQGSNEMIEISDMIRKHIPEHNQDAIIQSLRIDLNVINYKNLNIDKEGLKQIMNYAVVAGILNNPIDIEAFADESFDTEITLE